jgi:GNAT superfamily N-acetyltransferase
MRELRAARRRPRRATRKARAGPVHFSIRPMKRSDIHFAVRATDDMGWGFLPGDYRRILALSPGGSFVATLGKERIGVTTTLDHRRTSWIGSVIVVPKYRKMGVGLALVKKALGHSASEGKNAVGLISMPGTVDFYRPLGFRPRGRLTGVRGRISLKPFPSENAISPCLSDNVRPVTPALLRKVLAVDRVAFGDDRSNLLRRLARDHTIGFMVFSERGKVIGYIVCKRGVLACEVGPWVCQAGRNDAASALLFSLASRCRGPMEFYIPESEPWAREFVKRAGLRPFQHYIEMERGRARKPSKKFVVLAPAGLEKG